MRWLFDWVFGDLLFRHRDALEYRVTDSEFYAMYKGGYVYISRPVDTELRVFVRDDADNVSFVGVFMGESVPFLWDSVLRYVSVLRGWPGAKEV